MRYVDSREIPLKDNTNTFPSLWHLVHQHQASRKAPNRLCRRCFFDDDLERLALGFLHVFDHIWAESKHIGVSDTCIEGHTPSRSVTYFLDSPILYYIARGIHNDHAVCTVSHFDDCSLAFFCAHTLCYYIQYANHRIALVRRLFTPSCLPKP
jgi:hypothetical protein